ncbi:MAG: bifunctional demethylmenaquinone methyltransferase/2-methoxy-6-polyprenyl-1,4-benzoquinol methylase UbiE [Gammaproteobacteria bacterium]|jgi:demethylmenaquinone methyltransferase/2-methoxy-6-polyprenyl-1,4-benzoquinol methylase|nr:bifunctional demethylmenaquinone methyltransferase/2-methoxy-6-polyprenyl-1,4-benzoquinol methylase UbiE [Gammaproteobacteria bacterium]
MSDKNDKRPETTHFGYRRVPATEKAGRVAEVFHSVAQRYDLMNDMMSFGIHRIWKRYTLEIAAPRPGERILDLAGGTGDLAANFARRVGADGRVVLCDINASMLEVGRTRLTDRGIAGNLSYVQADAERLPFAEGSFDCVTIAFGLRNVTHKDIALRSMLRVLRPGGRALVLEFSRPARWLSPFYDWYSFNVLPRLGSAVAGDAASYRYLAESIRKHPDQDSLLAQMREAGFTNSDYFNLSAGIVALHRGYRP